MANKNLQGIKKFKFFTEKNDEFDNHKLVLSFLTV